MAQDDGTETIPEVEDPNVGAVADDDDIEDGEWEDDEFSDDDNHEAKDGTGF